MDCSDEILLCDFHSRKTNQSGWRGNNNVTVLVCIINNFLFDTIYHGIIIPIQNTNYWSERIESFTTKKSSIATPFFVLFVFVLCLEPNVAYGLSIVEFHLPVSLT
jgi:hypothetical protein